MGILRRDDDRPRNPYGSIEMILVFLCYTIGIGSILYGSLSILYGSLSDNNYGYHFIIIGVLALILVILHAARRAAQYNENVKVS